MNKIAEALKQAQLAHILSLCQDIDVVGVEVDAFVSWLGTLPLKQLIPVDQIVKTAEAQILSVPISQGLMQQIVAITHAVLDHPINDKTSISELIPDSVVVEIADYVSTQKKHRENLVHEVFNNPTYVDMLSNTISHAISDYMNNNALAKSVPGVSGLMKFGKAALEKATSTNLDEALQSYLNRNIHNLTQVSERMANKHLDDKQMHQLIIQSWGKIKRKPVSEIRQYVTPQVVDDGAVIVNHTWEHLRIHEFIQQQVKDAIRVWYNNNADKTMLVLLAELHVDAVVIRKQLTDAVMPIVKQLVDGGYIAARVEPLLDSFYNSDVVAEILK